MTQEKYTIEVIMSSNEANLVIDLLDKHNSELSLWIAKDIQSELNELYKSNEEIRLRRIESRTNSI